MTANHVRGENKCLLVSGVAGSLGRTTVDHKVWYNFRKVLVLFHVYLLEVAVDMLVSMKELEEISSHQNTCSYTRVVKCFLLQCLPSLTDCIILIKRYL